jgi:hypothetical protein
MRYRISGIMLAGLWAAAFTASAQPTPHRSHAAAAEPENNLPGENKKCPMPEGYYFTYRFASRPKLGTAILKIQVFDQAGRRTTGFSIKGNCGMPEMGSAHDSGEQDFKLSRKGDYLLPVDIVMPGEWKFSITFFKGKKRFHHGAFTFKV